MNVQELIDELNKVKDKNSDVRIMTMRDRDDDYQENQWLETVDIETLDTSLCDMPDYPDTCDEVVLRNYNEA